MIRGKHGGSLRSTYPVELADPSSRQDQSILPSRLPYPRATWSPPIEGGNCKPERDLCLGEGKLGNVRAEQMVSVRGPRRLGVLGGLTILLAGFVLVSGWAGVGSYSGHPVVGTPAVPSGPVPTVDRTTYPVFFNETGLWGCTAWSVTLDNSTFYSGTPPCGDPWPGFNLPNGTYSFVVAPVPGYNETPRSGNVTVAGANVIVNLTFQRIMYPVVVYESGLPLGTAWYVNITPTYSYGPSFSSTTSTIAFEAANGTWAYSASAVGFHTGGGRFTVDATRVSVNVTFLPGALPLYALTFTVTGWPVGIAWSVAVYDVTKSTVPSANASFISFYVPNGTYPYSLCFGAASCSTYSQWMTWAVGVQGAPVTIPTEFYPATSTYATTFRETGLRAAQSWLLVLDGTPYRTSQSAMTFQLQVGNHSYLIEGPAGQQVTGVQPAGTLSITGATNESVVFRRGPTYAITFARAGLPWNESWCVSLQGLKDCASGASLRFGNLTPGTYAYNVGPMVGQTITARSAGQSMGLQGNLTVRSHGRTVALVYVYPYRVTFTEAGLPSGAWSVTIRGVTRSNATGDPIGFNLPNGTYGYRIGTVSGYASSGAPKRAFVDGAAASVGVAFTKKAPAPAGSVGGTREATVVSIVASTSGKMATAFSGVVAAALSGWAAIGPAGATLALGRNGRKAGDVSSE
jgi:hypothetical protein